VAAQHHRPGCELERRSDLQAQQVHVHAAQPLCIAHARQSARDPAVEVEPRLLERGELVAGRRTTDEIDRQRAEVAVLGQGPLGASGARRKACRAGDRERDQEQVPPHRRAIDGPTAHPRR